MVRLTSALRVSVLTRRAFAEGGSAAVLAKGDVTAGAILLILTENGAISALWEPMPDLASGLVWTQNLTQSIENKEKVDAYIARRRAYDPDLWVVEVDVADAPRFAALMLASG